MVSNPALYSGSHGFKSQPRYQLSWQMFCDFPQSFLTNAKISGTLNKATTTSICLFIKHCILTGPLKLINHEVIRLERCPLFYTHKFQQCTLHHDMKPRLSVLELLYIWKCSSWGRQHTAARPRAERCSRRELAHNVVTHGPMMEAFKFLCNAGQWRGVGKLFCAWAASNRTSESLG